MAILRASKPIALIVLLSILAACGGAPAAQAPTNATVATAVTAPITAPASTDAPAPTDAPAISTASYPVTIENCGVTTTYAAAPQRAVGLYPPATEMLLRLGLKDQIIGIAASGDAPLPADLLADYRSLPSLSKASLVSKEVLLSARPDFVFDNSPDYFYDAAQGFATQDELRSAGANIYTITGKCGGSKPDASIEDVYTDLRNLGKIFGVSDKAEAQIATMQQRIAVVQAAIKGQPPVKVIYYDAGEGPLGIFGKGAWEYVLTLAGGQNVFGDTTEGYVQISAEQVAARDTDVFIVAGYTGEGVKTPEERVAYLKATFPNSTAVKNDRVIVIPYEYTNPGLQNVEGVEALAKALYPNAFAAAPTASTASYPITIENCGRTLTFEKPPERIVATFQSVAEAIIALGEGAKVVGLYFGQVQDTPAGMESAFAAIPTLGEGGFPSREIVLNAKPDLVVAYGLDSDFSGEQANVREALEGAGTQIFGINCAAAPTDTTASYYQRLRDLGTVLGRNAEAQKLVDDMQARIAAVQSKVEGREVVRGVFYYSGEGPFVVYGSGIANELIAAAGGQNVFATQASDFPEVTAEAIAAANSDAFFWSDFGPLGAPYLPKDPLQFLFTTFPSTDAAKSQRGGAVIGAGFYPSIRMAEAVEALAKALHPEAFK